MFFIEVLGYVTAGIPKKRLAMNYALGEQEQKHNLSNKIRYKTM